ncbi:MAG TPA: UDP-3-O-(3-hydroxymyristoyl)glucosamine N-acyltransferase [Bacteroidales bacterium]|nr:UDP-3-O-(3-hydroxymyristoyl)glucosamine N-acyltransferase [Bacteroidales bacterium]
MEFTAGQISQMLGGEVVGNDNVVVNTLCKIEEGIEKGMSFLSNPKYEHYIYDTKASVVIVNKSFEPEKDIKTTIIKVDDAYACFAKVLDIYNEYMLNKEGVSSLSFISKTSTIEGEPYIGEFAFIGENVKIGQGAKIYPHVYIGDNVQIGDNVTFFSGAKVYHSCVIGNNCSINSGAVIGADGFGFAPLADGSFKKIAQIGNVILEDNVDIGANTTIDRATMGSTIIKKGVKLDNLIQIAHNVIIDENTVMAAQAGVSGTTKIGKNCFIGGQVGFAGHITIGDNVKIGAQSGIMSNIEDNASVLGSPSWSARPYMKSYLYFRKLPDLADKINELEKRIKELEK